MLTIEDIRNPTRKSGFEHVSAGNSGGTRGHGGGNMFSARSGPRKLPGDSWYGPRRATAKEAAQDYCDYVNSGQAPAPKRPKAPKHSALYLKSAGHPRTRAKPLMDAAKSRRLPPTGNHTARNRQGVVYLIGEKGSTEWVKIGWSKSAGFTRLADLQTGNPRILVGIAERPGKLRDEYALHLQFEPDNVLQEWFEVSPELLSEFGLTQSEFEGLVA